MNVRTLLARALIIAAALGSQGLYCQSGADCSEACDVVRDCPGLNKTFLLSCSRLGPPCLNNQIGTCAECITRESTTCADLIAGKCDIDCVPDFDGGPPPVVDAGQPDAGVDAGP
jgi:hypothetical protein